MLKCISHWSLDHTEQKVNHSKFIRCSPLGFQDTGQFVKGQCTFVQGVKFSNSSDLNENCLKLLHVIQGTIKRYLPYLKCWRSIRFMRSKVRLWIYCIWAELWPLEYNRCQHLRNCKLIFYGSLYYMEQFETNFIRIGAIWKCDPLYKSALTFQ